MSVKSIPRGYHSLIPYITVINAVEAITFYKEAFGAVENGRLSMPDGNIAHTEIQIGESKIMMEEES